MTSPMLDSQAPTPTLVPDKPINKLNKEDIAKVSAWVNGVYGKAKRDRNAIERQWYLNLAFYFGKQNVALISTTAATNGFFLQTPKAPPYRVRLVVNKIRPIIRGMLSKYTAQKPMATAIPTSSDEEDLTAARVAESIFESTYETYNLAKVLRRALWWTAITGTGYIKDFWDPSKTDKTSGQVGDFCFEPLSPFHIYVPDLSEEELEKQPWVIHASTKTEEWVNKHYKTTLDGKKLTPNTKSQNEVIDDGFLGMIGARSSTPDAVLVVECWVKPGANKFMPNGGLITVIDSQIVEYQDSFPYEHGDFPFSKFDDTPTGRFYAESIIVDLIPLQREYNRTRSQIIEAKNLMAKPKLMAQKGAINPNQITSEPGQVILYEVGYQPPVPLQMQPLPAYVMETLDRLSGDFDDISGQHEISRGRTPPQVTAATAISYLQEQDDSKLAFSIYSVEEGVQRIGRHLLSYVQQYWGVGRLIKVLGKDGSFDAQVFSGADLRGTTDLRIQAGSALPHSKAARQALVMDMLKMGVIPPEKAMAAMDLGGLAGVMEDYQVDVRQAQRENLRMSAYQPQPQPPMQVPFGGQQPPASVPEMPTNSYDNHAVHVDVHNKFRKSQQFENSDPMIKQMFEAHVQLHQQETLRAQMQQQQPQQGGPPQQGPPQPGGPPNG